MTVEKARIFIKKAATDHQLRDRLNEAPTQEAVDTLLEAEGLPFTHVEFAEAYSYLLARSQSAEEASLIREIKCWWDYLLAVVNM
jgi:predicted ribosomally synthesized peptide with nif11-like leader